MTVQARQLLPRLAPAQAALLSRLAATLNGARIVPTRAASPGWIVLRAEPDGWELWLSPLSAGDRPLRITADDGRADALRAAVAMEAVEPALSALETALGVTLRPLRVTDDPAPTAAVTVDVADCAVMLAFDAQGDAAPIPISTAPTAIAAVPIAAEWRVKGPVVDQTALTSLGRGDMILFPRSTPATLVAGGASWPARADLANQTLSIEPSGSMSMSDQEQGWSAARTPVQLVIDGGAVTVGSLAALAPGSVLTLDLKGEILPVEIRAAGQRLGRGELVAVGDAFGVILTEVEGRAAPAPPQETRPVETADA